MEAAIEIAKHQAIYWTSHYGYHAVIPALLVDPAGVPWAWIFLMLLAGEAGKSLPLMFAYGFVVLYVSDHILYWLGAVGGRRLVQRLEPRWPKMAEAIHGAEAVVRERDFFAVTFGRYLPFVGRWAPLGAGMADVPFVRFAFLDAIGVAITVFGFGLMANWVGRKTINSPYFHQMVVCAFVGGTIVTIGYIMWQSWRARRQQAGVQPADNMDVEEPQSTLIER
jgi:membrane protein DedA with SNARE-associated domain